MNVEEVIEEIDILDNDGLYDLTNQLLTTTKNQDLSIKTQMKLLLQIIIIQRHLLGRLGYGADNSMPKRRRHRHVSRRRQQPPPIKLPPTKRNADLAALAEAVGFQASGGGVFHRNPDTPPSRLTHTPFAEALKPKD